MSSPTPFTKVPILPPASSSSLSLSAPHHSPFFPKETAFTPLHSPSLSSSGTPRSPTTPHSAHPPHPTQPISLLTALLASHPPSQPSSPTGSPLSRSPRKPQLAFNIPPPPAHSVGHQPLSRAPSRATSAASTSPSLGGPSRAGSPPRPERKSSLAFDLPPTPRSQPPTQPSSPNPTPILALPAVKPRPSHLTFTVAPTPCATSSPLPRSRSASVTAGGRRGSELRDVIGDIGIGREGLGVGRRPSVPVEEGRVPRKGVVAMKVPIPGRRLSESEDDEEEEEEGRENVFLTSSEDSEAEGSPEVGYIAMARRASQTRGRSGSILGSGGEGRRGSVQLVEEVEDEEETDGVDEDDEDEDDNSGNDDDEEEDEDEESNPNDQHPASDESGYEEDSENGFTSASASEGEEEVAATAKGRRKVLGGNSKGVVYGTPVGGKIGRPVFEKGERKSTRKPAHQTTDSPSTSPPSQPCFPFARPTNYRRRHRPNSTTSSLGLINGSVTSLLGSLVREAGVVHRGRGCVQIVEAVEEGRAGRRKSKEGSCTRHRSPPPTTDRSSRRGSASGGGGGGLVLAPAKASPSGARVRARRSGAVTDSPSKKGRGKARGSPMPVRQTFFTDDEEDEVPDLGMGGRAGWEKEKEKEKGWRSDDALFRQAPIYRRPITPGLTSPDLERTGSGGVVEGVIAVMRRASIKTSSVNPFKRGATTEESAPSSPVFTPMAVGGARGKSVAAVQAVDDTPALGERQMAEGKAARRLHDALVGNEEWYAD